MAKARHDERFKAVLEEFLPEFLRLFFPELAATLDLSSVRWERQEVADPPSGGLFRVDLVARVHARLSDGSTGDALVPVLLLEVESEDSARRLREQLFDYFAALKRRTGLLVVPVALYLQVGLEGVGTDTFRIAFAGVEIVRFTYWYVGLPALDAERYLRGDNWLGVALAALMRMPEEQRVRLKAEGLLRLQTECKENAYRTRLLDDLFGHYLRLTDEQQQAYNQLVTTDTRYQAMLPEGRTMREQAAFDANKRLLRKQLEKRFGPLPAEAVRRLEECDDEEVVERWALECLDAPSLQAMGLLN